MPSYQLSPGVLRSLREVRGLDLEAASRLLGVEPQELRRLEEGQEPANLGVLRDIARKYRFPLATLAHRRPLEPREPLTDFRTIEGAPAAISLELAIALDEASQIKEFAADLIDENPDLYTVPLLPQATTQTDAAQLAAQERQRLNYTENIQLNSRDAAEVFNILRARVEAFGVLVYMVNLPLQDCRGFCLVGDRMPPLIAVNDAEPTAEAKTFTLIHEYCHVLLRAPGISGIEIRNPTERFCNLFTANLLMPNVLVERVLGGQVAQQEWDREEIARWARRLRVSQQALALRLEEMGRVPPGFYERWMAGLQGVEPPVARVTGYVPYERRILRRFGTAYAGLVLGALANGNINQLDAYRLLKVKPVHLDALRRELEDRRQKVGVAGA